MTASEKFFRDLFMVPFRGQTYLNLLYLLFSFPLGLAYFIVLVTGLSLGIGLIILWVGVFILVGLFALWIALARFERRQAMVLLHEEILPFNVESMAGKSIWQQFVAYLKNPVTWKGLVYLLLKFPLGVFSFTLLVTLLSVSLALLTVPFYYQIAPISVNLDLAFAQPWMVVDTLSEAMTLCVIGAVLTLLSLHVLNGLAWVSGKFARVMLGNYAAQPAAHPAPKAVEAAAPAAASLAAAEAPVNEAPAAEAPVLEDLLPAEEKLPPASD